ncbi:MAG: glycyl-radical enzyme activating protein [Propionibacteriaceae bacterium]|nr:glycyl-radical enzyme activating protein [Propionibacteriaceae bacterium]
MKGFISAFQDYSTKDGPGLRQTVFLKRCNLRCLWCCNPETLEPGEELFFFPERIKDAQLALAENPNLAQTPDGWQLDRAGLPDPEAVLERNTQPIFEPVGQWVEAQECARRILRDKAFYDASGGGATFSGGEPMLQPDFIAEVQGLLRGTGVRTAIDTAGNVPWESFEKVLDATDLFLYDIKAADSGLHKKLTGVGNERILENARLLGEAARELWVRLVVVPGLNDTPADLGRRLELVAHMGAKVTRVDVLGYHSLGVGKYRRLGREYPLHDVPALDPAVVEGTLTYAAGLGLPVHYEPGLT